MTVKTAYDHGTFSWVDLVAHDMGAARELYGNLFGWQSVELDPHADGSPPYAAFTLDGDQVAGVGQMSDEMKSAGIPPMWNSYVNVDDVEAITARAAELGAEIAVPVIQAAEAGWLSFIKDPTGGHVGFWQKKEHVGAQRVNEPGSFAWNELATRDVDRAKEFYGALLGWEYARVDGAPTDYFLIKNAGNDNGGIMAMNEQWGDIPPHWMVYFAVADTDASVARLEKLGGKVDVPAFDTPYGRMSVVADPQGAVMTLIKLQTPPA